MSRQREQIMNDKCEKYVKNNCSSNQWKKVLLSIFSFKFSNLFRDGLTMDSQTEGQKDVGQKNSQTEGQLDSRTVRQSYRRTFGQKKRKTIRQKDSRAEGQSDSRTFRQRDTWTEGESDRRTVG